MTALRPLRLRSVFARLVLLVTATALVTGAVTILVATTLVQSDKQAEIVEDTVNRAERGRAELTERLALSRAELRSVALAGERGLLMEVPRLVSGRIVAVEAYRGEEELLVAATDPGARTTLRGIARSGASVRLVSPLLIFVEVELTGTNVRGLVDVSDILAAAPGWRLELAESDLSRAVPGGAIVARPVEEGGEPMLSARADTTEGLSLSVLAPLAPAQRAASVVTQRVLLYSLLSLLPIVLLVWVLTNRVTAPVRALAHAVHRAHEGDIALPPLPDDEIGELGAAIGSMSKRLRHDAEAQRHATEFARWVNRLADASDIRAALQKTLGDLVPQGKWWVLAPSDAEKPPPGMPIARARLRELFKAVEGDSGRPPPGGRESGVVSLEARQESLIVSLYGTRSTQAVVVGAGELDDTATRMAHLLCRVTQSALRACEAARNATDNEKLAVLGRLAAGVTHEMNNPLAFVLTNVQLLESELQGEQKEAATDARIGVERVTRIVRDLSSLAKGGTALDPTVTDVCALVRESAKVARARHPAIRVIVEAAPSALVICDKGRIDQALLNLMANALDAALANPEPMVTVAVQVEARLVRVSVKDNGPGIPVAVRERLFEPFFTTKRDLGTGLGLFISRALVRAHGGDIVISNTGPEGTTITLQLPLGEEESSLGPRPQRPVLRRPRVLIVDDEPNIVSAMVRWFEPRAEVIGVTDPKEALALAMGPEGFDLVLTDYDMPGMTGLELSDRIEAAHPEMVGRVLVMTGSSGFRSTRRRVLTKPVPATVLESVLAEATETQRSA